MPKSTPRTQAQQPTAETASKQQPTAKTSKQQPLTLADLRTALSGVEAQRATTQDPEQRLALEEAAITLRQAQRTAIKDAQKEMIKEFKATAQDVNLQSKKIRETVTKLNKIDKIMDGAQNVLKECVRVLKAIASLLGVSLVSIGTLGIALARNFMCMGLLAIMACGMFTSCAMTKSQLAKVNSLAITSDSVALAPSAIFSKLASTRRDRGLIYVASLEGTETRLTELDNLYSAIQSDQEIISQADAYVSILNSYIKALKSLTAPTRYSQYGTTLRGIGRNVDSLFIAYNALETKLEHEDRLIAKENIGIAKQIGKSTGYMASETGRRVQRRLMKKFLSEGDTLVATCCDRLAEIVKKEQINQLISIEEQGLRQDYRSYLNAMHNMGRPVNTEFDATYLTMRQNVTDARKIQSKCVSALNSLKKAHHKLLEQMDNKFKNGPTYEEYAESLMELGTQAADLRKLFK